MITAKQRAKLRGLANSIDTILQVGKGGVADTLIAQIDGALTARELIKIRVLPACELTAKETAQRISEKVGAQVVQVIGTKIVLYRNNPKKNLIDLDK